MDWTAFWTGVGALATVVTLVIGLIVFIRGRSRVVVRVVRHDNYTLPPSLIEFFDQLERVGYSSLPKPDFIESVEPDEMRELLQALKDIQKNKKLMEFIRFPGSPKMWVFNVINRGHERAEKIELQVAEAIQTL